MSLPANLDFKNVSFNQQGGSYTKLTATTNAAAVATAGPFEPDTAPEVGDRGTLKGMNGGLEYSAQYMRANVAITASGSLEFILA
ncbi:MAG: hypothetical protein HRT53_01860 [Colwellia sp.]|nr:hypothetical protein [Colwellia sp.]